MSSQSIREPGAVCQNTIGPAVCLCSQGSSLGALPRPSPGPGWAGNRPAGWSCRKTKTDICISFLHTPVFAHQRSPNVPGPRSSATMLVATE